MSDLNTILYLLVDTIHQASADFLVAFGLIPVFILYETPLIILIVTGILRYHYREMTRQDTVSFYQPRVSCIVTCYSEGEAIALTAKSLAEQTYPGSIEIILVVDGAVQNKETYETALRVAKQQTADNRKIIVLPKWQRGGRVSSCNAGLDTATGEIVLALDGDTSFDNDMIARIVPHFEDPRVPATSGAIRVRNSGESIFAKFQSIEYLMSMQGSKTGLAEWNLQTNISGAFGAFRRSVLEKVGGWTTHSAEDLDLTIRLKQYQVRHPNWYIPYEPLAIALTDVPVKLKDLIKQRLRWDGDLFFIFFRKHWQSFSPKLVGFKHYIFTLLYGWIQNVVLPFVVIGYAAYLFISLPATVALSLFIGVYLVYMAVLMFFFLFIVIAMSERIKKDLSLFPLLVIFPLYSIFMRVVAVFALINELVRHSHEESAMAPWWVFKRGGKF
ncbi:glycosyltransferase family 2 protein [Idiomarina ramblicola]|uniref:N-acetylglucosaminyltransferase n=1 Tax=Idiomarina ramblicola TaxID=263724 RepID=A0A432Z1D6_9GAMM|nr:glycosyltransferase [Idiomarina ramblicola]RUO71710.1 N-acetylglucosaminyltransferase [Idiomarina ramblicola]